MAENLDQVSSLLRDALILVTGGGQGNGRAIALGVAAAGARVIVTDIRQDTAQSVADEIQARGFGRDIPAGFLCYPVAQAADITAFKAVVVPVGEDQAPLIEQTNEIVRRINHQVGRDVLPQCTALIPKFGRLPGVDGKAKMSKSQGNAIALGASPEQIKAALEKFRAARKAKQDALTKAQADLKSVLSVKQEAVAVSNGLLE